MNSDDPRLEPRQDPDAAAPVRPPARPSVRVEGDTRRALDAVEEMAEVWGGELRRSANGGHLELPVVAGVRRGRVAGEITTRSAGGATHVTFELQSEDYRLQGRELVVLVLGALGGLFIVVAPFVPGLFDLIPAAGILLLLAWFLVVSRLRHRSARDFLDEVAELAKEPEADDG